MVISCLKKELKKGNGMLFLYSRKMRCKVTHFANGLKVLKNQFSQEALLMIGIRGNCRRI